MKAKSTGGGRGRLPILIGGQGIAGTMLCWELMENGLEPARDFIVADLGAEEGSSWYSTGLINPVVFKRMTLSWGSAMIPAAWRRYRGLESFLKERGYTSDFTDRRPIVKVFLSENERRRWEAGGDAAPALGPLSDTGEGLPPSNFGSAEITGSGRILPRPLLRSFRRYLADEGALIETAVEDLLGKPGYSAAVMATGIQRSFSPSQEELPGSALPYYPVKGDVIEITLPGLASSRVLSAGVAIIPTDKPQTYLVGSSYVRDFTDTDCEEEGVSWLLSRLYACGLGDPSILRGNVTDCWAGIRPASRDRLAYLGLLEPYSLSASIRRHLPGGVYVFNGLGTRGFMLAPGLAEMLCGSILHGRTTPDKLSPGRIGT